MRGGVEVHVTGNSANPSGGRSGRWGPGGGRVALPTMGNVCPAERKGDIGMLMAGVVGRSGETSSI